MGVPSYYCNHIEITQTKHEFALTFGQLPTRFSPERLESVKSDGIVHVEPVLEVLIPPTVLPGLIKALESQKKHFETLHGAIQDDSTWAKEKKE